MGREHVGEGVSGPVISQSPEGQEDEGKNGRNVRQEVVY